MKIQSAICCCLVAGALLAGGCRSRETYEKPLTPVQVQEVREYYPGADGGTEEKYSADRKSVV